MVVQHHAAPFLHPRLYPPPPRYCITDMTGSVSSAFSCPSRKSNAMPFQTTLPYAQLVFDRQQQALVTLMEVHIVGSRHRRQRIRLWDTPHSFYSTTTEQQQQQGLEVEDVSSNSSLEEEHVDDDDENDNDESSPASRDLVDLYLLSEYHSKGHYHPDYDTDKGKCTDALVAFLAEVKAKVVARRRKLEEENQEEMLPDYDLMSV